MTDVDIRPSTDEELRGWLATDADRYDMPLAGPDRVRAAAMEDRSPAGPGPAPTTSWADGSNSRGRGRRSKVVVGVVATAAGLALLVATVGHAGRGTKSASTDAAGGVNAGKSAPLVRSGSPGEVSGPSQGAPSTSVPAGASGVPTATDQSPADAAKIIKTGSIELGVPRRTFSDRVARLTSLSRGLGGFIAETSTSEQSAAPSGTITLRVPADRFEELLVQVRRLGHVHSATTGSQDVTSEYTDVTGRLKTMQDERGSLDLLVTHATNLPDILAVRDRLNAVQAEIEQLGGRRKVLADQTSLATLAVSLQEPGATAPLPAPHQRSGLSQAWHRAVDGFTAGVEAIIGGSGTTLLILLCAGAAWLAGSVLWRRYRRSLV